MHLLAVNLSLFVFLQSFPTEFAQCSCSGSGCGTEYQLCGISLANSVNLTQGLTPPNSGTFNPVQVAGTDVLRFSFSGNNPSSTSFYTMDAAVKNSALDFTDNFSTSTWLKCNDNSRPSQYVFSFDNDDVSNGNGKRTYTWRFRRDNRLTLFYTRGRLDNIPASQPDSGENSRVGLSFYFQSAVSTTNICDGVWHFYKLDITYPSIKLFVDGYVHYATEGHYFGVSNNLIRLSSGSVVYDMPARLNVKTNKDAITGRIGSSSRFLDYGFNGELRLLMMTNLLDNSQYTCLASCNNSLVHSEYSPGTGDVFNNTIGSFTNVFYQPVSRTLYFSNAGGSPSDYTAFLRNISYNTNGHLPAQTVANMGEGRRIELQVNKVLNFILNFTNL